VKKVDMSPNAISERLRVAGALSEELLKSTFSERYRDLMRERADLSKAAPNAHEKLDDLSDNTGDQVSQG
jgi:hypothetical protein